MYNLAKKYGTVPAVRHRVINAPQMETHNHRYIGNENFYVTPPKIYMCTVPQPQQPGQTKKKLNNKLKSISYKSLSSDRYDEDEEEDDKEYRHVALGREQIGGEVALRRAEEGAGE